ncbi:MAG: FAD:protein FMN transferase [Alphaproteobacteria bacterium]
MTPTRRRFIAITAAAAGVGAHSALAAGAMLPGQPVIWRGAALGARAQITLFHHDARWAQAQLGGIKAEIDRLENLFSLYRENSDLARLNRTGRLANPAIDMIELLSRAIAFTDISNGAFDISVQPLWQLYARHFAKSHPDPAGPSAADLATTLKLVGAAGVRVSAGEISLAQPGMALTLNGVAQGYVTDKITSLLKRAGFADCLVWMGETYGLGTKPDGAPWMAGIASPAGKIATRVALSNRALATSGGYGSPFSTDGRHHHLLDPRTGRSARHYASVSVMAPDATTADMASTALYILPEKKARQVLARLPGAEAILQPALSEQNCMSTESTLLCLKGDCS